MGRAFSGDSGLERIVAMLVALAVLAERAACRSFPVRWVVLALLRRADAVARAHVAEETGWEWPFFDEAGEGGSEPADAILLAARLRALAAWLAALLSQAARIWGHAGTVDAAPGRPASFPGWFAFACTAWTGRLNDTS